MYISRLTGLVTMRNAQMVEWRCIVYNMIHRARTMCSSLRVHRRRGVLSSSAVAYKTHDYTTRGCVEIDPLPPHLSSPRPHNPVLRAPCVRRTSRSETISTRRKYVLPHFIWYTYVCVYICTYIYTYEYALNTTREDTLLYKYTYII